MAWKYKDFWKESYEKKNWSPFLHDFYKIHYKFVQKPYVLGCLECAINYFLKKMIILPWT